MNGPSETEEMSRRSSYNSLQACEDRLLLRKRVPGDVSRSVDVVLRNAICLHLTHNKTEDRRRKEELMIFMPSILVKY
jgi:hypothetical protein